MEGIIYYRRGNMINPNAPHPDLVEVKVEVSKECYDKLAKIAVAHNIGVELVAKNMLEKAAGKAVLPKK
jgi:hypothetical protein